MPLTPFHFGPGVLAKAALPSRFSLSSFLLTQVVIDTEVLYHAVRGDWPLHRFLHTLPGCTLAGAVSAAAVWAVGRFAAWRSASSWWDRCDPSARSELIWSAALVGALFGAWSHVALDGFLYDDVHIFWPLSSITPLWGMVSPRAIHVACVLAGGLGVVVLLLQRRRAQRGPTA
jgi:hypothetical protein